jgi:hypothetical protein
MLGNENLDREEILRAHREAAIKRMMQSETTILAIQDTTSVNYNTQTKMEGTGYISDKTLGVNIRNCMYELYGEAAGTGRAFLIRIARNRKTVGNTKILDEIKEKPCGGRVKTTILRDSRRNIKGAKRYCRYGIAVLK